MSAQRTMVTTQDPDGKWLYRLGGVAAVAIGVAYIAIIALYAAVGVSPEGGEASWTNYGALILLSDGYAAAASESQRAMFVAAATYASAVLESPLAGVWAIGTLSFAFLLIGFVMLRGVFNKLTAYVGIVTGVLGIAAVAGVDIAVILNAVFATIWVVLVGYRLYRLARQ